MMMSNSNEIILSESERSQGDKPINYIEIKDSELLPLIGSVSIFLIPPIISFLLLMDTILKNSYIFIVWLFLLTSWPLICLILAFIIKGFHKATCLVTDLKIEFYLNDNLYINISWSEIEKIIIIKEEYDIPTAYGPSKESGYRLNFAGQDLDQSIRLFCCPFCSKKQLLIINSLKEFSNYIDSQIVFEELRGEHYTTLLGKENPCRNLNNFRKKQRSIKKLKEEEK